jgi:hypothetical protein
MCSIPTPAHNHRCKEDQGTLIPVRGDFFTHHCDLIPVANLLSTRSLLIMIDITDYEENP